MVARFECLGLVDVPRRQGCMPGMIVRLQSFFLPLPVANFYKAISQRATQIDCSYSLWGL